MKRVNPIDNPQSAIRNSQSASPEALPPSTVPTKYWHALEDGRIQCDLCPRFLQAARGPTGVFVFVRAREGRPGGTHHLRPIQRVFASIQSRRSPCPHFLPGTAVLSFGTAGCNLGCKILSELGTSASPARSTPWPTSPTPEAIARACPAARLPERRVHLQTTRSSFTSTRSTSAAACREAGIRTVAVTAGENLCRPPRRVSTGPWDAANVDLKAFPRRVLRADLQRPARAGARKRSSTSLAKRTSGSRSRNLIIPGENDSEAELQEMTAWIVEHLGTPTCRCTSRRFHPDFRMLDHPSTPPAHAPPCTRDRAGRRRALRLRWQTCPAKMARRPYCHACGQETQSAARGYELVAWHLTADGRCPGLRHPVPRRLRTTNPATWGRAPASPCKLADYQ